MTKTFLIALVALGSCSPVYVPNLRNSPMFTKGGEFQASVQVGNGIEGQSAFAVTDHFGLISNYAYINETDSENEDNYHRHRFFEGAAGYFTNNGENFFEVFAGYGRGKASTFDGFEFFGPQTVAATGRYERYFLQPSFGLNKDEMNFAFVSRVSMVDFYEFANEIGAASVHEKPKFFFEPAIVGRANFSNNHLFVTFQAGACLGMSDNVYFDRRTFQLAGGVGLRLGGVKKLVNRL